MKMKRGRALEVPPKIRSFINNVTSVPLEDIEEPLKGFVWEFDKGDFHHWADLFNHFDSFFEKHIKFRKDLQVEDNFLGSDSPFPREAVLQILRVIRIILENCTNKQFYSSYEQHLSCLLASTDADIVEACLQTLAAFLKKSIGKHTIRDASLNSKLFSLAQGWGGKEEGLGLIACALQNGCSQVTHELGCTLHFEFYAINESGSEIEQLAKGLQIIHLSNVSFCLETDLELLSKLIARFNVPTSLRFSLLTRMRFARAFHSLSARQQYTCIRLYAFIVLVQASGDTDDLVTFFNSEPEFVNELVGLLSYEDEVPVKIRILCLLSLVALCQDRSHQPTVLSAVTSGGHRGILSSLMQKAVDSVITDTTKCSILFAEALLSVITVLVSSSSGCSAMREAGFIPTLLPLLKDTNPQHLHLVSTAVHILEVFMDYSNPAVALFRDLGGLDDTISRLKVEVLHFENGSKQQRDHLEYNRRNWQVGIAASSDLDDLQPSYSEALLSYRRRLLMKALLRAISLGTYAPGNTARFYGSEENLLPHCLCIIFRRAKDFGGGVFSLAATVMSDLIHKDPTCFSVLDAAGLPAAFLDAVMDGVVCSAEAITCIPQCLDALCLNNNGLQAVKDRNALRCFVKIFTSRTYLRSLVSDASGSLSSGLDELMRHASSLRGPGVDMLLEILTSIVKIGSPVDASCMSIDPSCSSTAVPMETNVEERKSVLSDDKGTAKTGNLEQSGDELFLDQSIKNPESFLPDCVSNAARLLETVLQNADACRIFVEKKGIEVVLQLISLPLMPPSVSVGQSISIAFKSFSPQHSASLARVVCTFLKEHLKSTNEFLISIKGLHLALVESSKQTRGLKHLSCLESILCLCNFLLKGTTTLVSELGISDADILKDIGCTYREIIWQISLDNHSKTDDKKSADQESESSDSTPSNTPGRESDDDANMPVVRYMNPVSLRNGSHLWGGEREFLSVVHSSESLHRRSRHGLHLRGGRSGRYLEPFNIDSEASAGIPEASSTPELKKKSPEVLVSEILNKLASTLHAFFTALVKGFTSSNRRRVDSGSLNSASKALGTAVSKIFLDALSFSGHSSSSGLDISLPVKCQYLGKVVDDMAALTFDGRKRTCYSAMINNFYVHGTFKELITTFQATSQLLWSLPYSVQNSAVDHETTNEESNLSHSPWLFDTIQGYCRVLEYFVSSTLLLSPNSASQVQQLIQPVAVGLSIGLFPVPRDPEVFVRMLQAQVLDVLLPIWNHPKFPNCNPSFIASIVSLVTHIYYGVSDVKRNHNGIAGTTNPRFIPPPPNEATIATMVEMGFTRERAEEALRRVGINSVEMAMEWLFSHAEDPVQEDNELARALALSMGNSSESSKVDNGDKSMDVLTDEGHAKAPPVDDILAASLRLFQSSDKMAFTLTDLLVTLCNRNKGEDRPRVMSYLIHQLKLCPLDLTKDNGALSMLLHIIALLLFEDWNARKIAAQEGIVSVVIDILTNFKSRNAAAPAVPKCVSALLLILDSMLQCRPKIISENTVGSPVGSPPDLSGGGQLPMLAPMSIGDDKTDKTTLNADNKESGSVFENVLGKPTGYLTADECNQMMLFACDLIKQRVPGVIMQAVLQLCARLTKIHALALQFLENGGLVELFNLPRTCFFPGYDTLASAIVRHLLEDPQTLQTAMEMEIRQNLGGRRHAERTSACNFLASMSAVISRDPMVFMKASAAVCQLETSGGHSFVVLSKEREKEKEKEKEKERSKVSGTEVGLSSNESVKISENKIYDGSGKYSKNHKKIPANLTQVINQLIEIVVKYPLAQNRADSVSNFCSMEVDEPDTKVKGKSKAVDKNNLEDESEKSTGLAKVTFVLKLLSDILLMYVHAVGVILRRDSEMCQLRGCNHLDSAGQGGIIYHILQRLLPLSVDKSAGPDEWRDKLSEKASYYLVVLCGRSSEGRRRVINELVKALSFFSSSESSSNKNSVLPDKRIFAFSNLAYSILSKNSSSSNLPGSGCSPDIAKSMIDGGMVQCLTNILQVVDLDHPDAPKIVNLILKALESLTRAANASEQIMKSDGMVKKKSPGLNERLGDQINTVSTDDTIGQNQNTGSQQLVSEAAENNQQEFATAQNYGNVHTQSNWSLEREMRLEVEGTMTANLHMDLGTEFMREEMGEAGVLHNSDQIEMSFHVENRADEEMGDEDDDAEDDDDDDDGEDVDEDIAEDDGGMMSLPDTDDTRLADDYNDEMVDEEDDDFHENRVIENRWREALDGFDHLQIPGQPGGASGLVDVATEPFEGGNVNDLFRFRRSLYLERRHQTGRSSFERSVVEVNGFQHPLLLRPSQSGGMVSMRSSTGNLSRDLDTLSSGSYDASNFYVFDAPVFPYNHVENSLFGGAAPPPLADYPIGIDPLPFAGRRGLGDGRWTDDGQPQGSTQAIAVAQAVEELFVSYMHGIMPAESLPQNLGVQDKQLDTLPSINNLVVAESGNARSQQNDDQNPDNSVEASHHETNVTVESAISHHVNSESIIEEAVENVQEHEPMSIQPHAPDITLSEHDRMDMGEQNGASDQQIETLPQFDNLDCDGTFEVPTDLHEMPSQAIYRPGSSEMDAVDGNHVVSNFGLETPNPGDCQVSSAGASVNVDMNDNDAEEILTEQHIPTSENGRGGSTSEQNVQVAPAVNQADQSRMSNEASGANALDPTFLEALPEDLRAEVLASQQAQPIQPPTYALPSADDIDPEFLAALPPGIQAEVLAQQRAQSVAQQAEGQPVDMHNASIIATLPANLRQELLLNSSEAVLSALPSSLQAEAQMLRDRAMSHYQAGTLFSNTQRLGNRRNDLGFNRQTVMDRGVGVTIGGRAASAIADSLTMKEIEGEPLLDGKSLKSLIRLLRLAQPLGKGLLQRLLFNLCAHSVTRTILVYLLLDMINSEAEGFVGGVATINSQRLYGCQSNVVYGQSQLSDGLPPLVLRRILEILTYLATNHSSVANMLFYFDLEAFPENLSSTFMETKKGKEKVVAGLLSSNLKNCRAGIVPLVLFLKLLNRPLFLRSVVRLEQVMCLLQVVVHIASSKLEHQSRSEHRTGNPPILPVNEASVVSKYPALPEGESKQESSDAAGSTSGGKRSNDIHNIFLLLPQSVLCNLCALLGREGLSDKVYALAGEILKKLSSVVAPHRKFFMSELSELANGLSSSAISELVTLKNTNMLGLSASSMAGAAIVRVLQVLSSLTSPCTRETKSSVCDIELEEQAIMWRLNVELEPLWQTLSDCISVIETQLSQSSSFTRPINVGGLLQGTISSSPLPPGGQRLLPFIEAFFVLSEKLQANLSILQQDHANITAREVKESAGSSDALSMKGADYQKKSDGAVTFTRFSERHRRILNAFIRQNPGLLEKSLSILLKAPRLIDFDNKRAYFRSRIRQQNKQHIYGPLQISVRRAYILEDSYNQLRKRPTQDLRGRLTVQFQGEEGVDAGGLTREWYQLLSRVIFDKGALLFTTVGNNVTFQPNPNSVYQTEHLSYFKFVGRVVAKALFDGQLLDVYFTRSFYMHILGVKVTYHDIEAVDPDYYKNLKWMLENDVSDIPDLTFSMDADEEKHILYEKNEVTDYELKPGGRNIRVTEETKHEYVDLVADHILTNAIRPQINSFLDGFNELVPRELISIFNDKELELLISGLPEIDLDDLKANTEYTVYTAASSVVQWFWEVVKSFSKEDMARLLQFVTGTSKVPLEGFKALQGISGPQRFHIRKAYGASDRLPSAHTCFNQLDLPEYSSKEQLQERLMLAIHEANEGFGFG
ncbi:E3 ubiquitin-protein ligase UPL1 isoform X1 [Cucurbita moschata]|uniref:HECT-type E3 ubiquitin transferase n=1 Tax=Cucurbita moschata TaxID=3662 RepID=A0A6J1EWH8_CUCMO|nr:E3 ubiquitin-protein ligase UPL1 isoform X1 [Cucurbita moschata]